MATPTVDDHFEIVTATVHWMTRQMPYRIPERPLLHVGSAALADALRTFDPGGPVGLETHCRHLVRRSGTSSSTASKSERRRLVP